MPPARSASSSRSSGSASSSGSARSPRAARTARAPGAAPGTRRRPRPRRIVARRPGGRVRWDRLGRVGLLVVLAVVAGLYVQHTLAYVRARSQADQQAAIVRRLTRENARLRQEQKALGDPVTIEDDARALGMVKAGERPYVITGLPRH